MDDEQLVELARQGDAQAFGELVSRHQHAAYRAAMAVLGHHADAEDVTQDAFVTAHGRLHDFRGDASFRTWLLTIAWRTALNRRRRITWWLRRSVEPVLEPTAAGPSPERNAAGRELARAVASEIKALSTPLRHALLLATSGDYTYDEMGAMLDAPVGTVKWRVSEARRRLRRRMEALGHDI